MRRRPAGQGGHRRHRRRVFAAAMRGASVSGEGCSMGERKQWQANVHGMLL
jgi:hypothetical protein